MKQHERQTHAAAQPAATPVLKGELTDQKSRVGQECLPSEYYWRARNADTNHQNTISGREDRESQTQCHQNTIGGRAMPTPVIRILLAREDHQRGTQCHQNTINGRRTTQVEHNAIRILLAGGGTTTVEHNAIRILLAGGRTTNVEHSAIRILLDRGPPRLGLTKLLTSGRRGFIYAR